MTDGFNTGYGKRRRRHAVDPSLGYWLDPSATSEDSAHAPIHCQTSIVPHDAPAFDFTLATEAERPRILDDGRMDADLFSQNVQINDGGNMFSVDPPQHSAAHTIDEERIRTLDRASPSLLSCYEKSLSISSSPPAVHDGPSQTAPITVEQFLQIHSRTRKPVKRRNYKRRPKVIIKSNLERHKESNSSFLREGDQLLSDNDENDENTLAHPTKWGREAQATSEYQATKRRRRTRKATEETNVVQVLELQEEPLPTIATRSLHEHWHPVDPRKGRPFIQPTFASGRDRIHFRPLKPAPIPPVIDKWTTDDLSDGFHDLQNVPLTKKAPGEKPCPSARMSLSMEPTEDHERKLKLWKSNNPQALSLKQLQLMSNDPAGASHLVHSPNVGSKTRLAAVPRRNPLGHVTIYDSAPSSAFHPTGAPNPPAYAEVASNHPTAPLSTATRDQENQGDQSMVLVEDSFLDVDEPERVSQPPTARPPQKLTHLSDILGTLLRTVKENKHH